MRCASVVLRQAAAAPPGNLLQIQILAARDPETETPGVGPRHLSSQPSRRLSGVLRSEKAALKRGEPVLRGLCYAHETAPHPSAESRLDQPLPICFSYSVTTPDTCTGWNNRDGTSRRVHWCGE